jgi:cytosine/adenosine deaminase-related metal-dependent hydrolase
VEAASRVGLRLLYVRGCSPRLEGTLAKQLTSAGVDLSRLVEPEDLALARTEEVLRSPGSDMLRWACGPTTPVIDDDGDFHRRLTRVADTHGVGLHTHFHPLAGTSRQGESAADLARRQGLVRDGNWFAHGSALAVADVASLGRDGVGVVHNPSCSVLLGYPIPDLASWCEGNSRVAVSVDGSASNDRGSMLGEAQLAWQLQRATRAAGQQGISAAKVMELASVGGARAIGWPGLGRLTVGSAADFAVLDLHDLDYAGAPHSALDDPATYLCRTYSGGRVRMLVVGGRTVVEKGRLTGVDEAVVAGDVAETARRLYPS